MEKTEKVKLPTFVCRACGHAWHPRDEKVPTRCAFCKTPFWNRQPTEISRGMARRRHEEACFLCKSR